MKNTDYQNIHSTYLIETITENIPKVKDLVVLFRIHNMLMEHLNQTESHLQDV